MVAKKKRTSVVLDTNVFVRSFLSQRKTSSSKRVVRLWLVEKQLQLVISSEILAEYLEIFERVLGLEPKLIEKWRRRFEEDSRTMMVGLNKRFNESRDPDDNLMLATAHAGRAQFLITNDKDLLDLPEGFKNGLPFSVVRPQDFLRIK